MRSRFLSLLWLLPFTVALSGCDTLDKMDLFGGDDQVETDAKAAQTELLPKYVSVIVQERYGFKIKDPMGNRPTGASCGVWKDNNKDSKGECCWNARGECLCPCPER